MLQAVGAGAYFNTLQFLGAPKFEILLLKFTSSTLWAKVFRVRISREITVSQARKLIDIVKWSNSLEMLIGSRLHHYLLSVSAGGRFSVHSAAKTSKATIQTVFGCIAWAFRELKSQVVGR